MPVTVNPTASEGSEAGEKFAISHPEGFGLGIAPPGVAGRV